MPLPSQFILLSLTSTGMSIHVTRSINHTTATADQPFSLTCFVNIRTNTSHFPLVITWQHTQRISSLTSTHVETLKNGTYNTTTATLSIQWPNFRVSQAGSYTCLAQLQSNEQAIVNEEVIVQGNSLHMCTLQLSVI